MRDEERGQDLQYEHHIYCNPNIPYSSDSIGRLIVRHTKRFDRPTVLRVVGGEIVIYHQKQVSIIGIGDRRGLSTELNNQCSEEEPIEEASDKLAPEELNFGTSR